MLTPQSEQLKTQGYMEPWEKLHRKKLQAILGKHTYKQEGSRGPGEETEE